MEMARLSTGEMLSGKDIDANANRERTRQKRLRKWLVILGLVLAYLVWRLANDNPIRLGIPGWLMGNPEIIIALGLDRHPRHRHLHPVPHRRKVAAHAAAGVRFEHPPRRRRGRRPDQA